MVEHDCEATTMASINKSIPVIIALMNSTVPHPIQKKKKERY
jgi:hypothetical protein